MHSTPPSKRIDKSADSSEFWGGFIWVDSKEFSKLETSVGSDKFFDSFSAEISEVSLVLSSE